MSQFMLIIQRLGHLLRQLNEKFFFYVDIQTVIPWAVIFLMYMLHKFIDKYLRDGIIDSMELLRLLGVYGVMLLGIMASYVDVGVIMQRANPQYSFFIITLSVFVIVVFIAWTTSQNTSIKIKEKIRIQNNEKAWILGALYLPIALIILTNGRILEKRADSLRGLLPRTDITFVDLPGEITSLKVGGDVSKEQLDQLERLVSSYEAIQECAIVGKMDIDNLIKPYAYVVLEEKFNGSLELIEDIKAYTAQKITDNWVSPKMYPYWIEFVDATDLAKLGGGDRNYERVREILNTHQSVKDSRIVGLPDKSTAYVTLKEGYPSSRTLGKEIIQYVYEQIRNNNRMSAFLVPQWIEFIEKSRLPRTSTGEINHNALQKKTKNWSDVFPAPPKDDPFVQQFGAN